MAQKYINQLMHNYIKACIRVHKHKLSNCDQGIQDALAMVIGSIATGGNNSTTGQVLSQALEK